MAGFTFLTMKNTPQSCGLPAIEEYKDDYPDNYSESFKKEMTAKEIFLSIYLIISYCGLLRLLMHLFI